MHEKKRTTHQRLTLVLMLAMLTVVYMTATAGPAASQQFEFSEFHTWTDIATIYKFNDAFRYDGDYGFLTSDDWTLIYLRPSVALIESRW